MLKKIESLRKKPKHVRNRYAFLTALIFTGMIVFVWMLSLPARFSHISVSTERSSGEMDDFRQVLVDIKSGVDATIQSVDEEVGLYKEEGVGLQGVSNTASSTSGFDTSLSVPRSSGNEDTVSRVILIGTTTEEALP